MRILTRLLAASLFMLSHAFAQVAELPNMVPICTESPSCVITAVSNPAAVLQFGSGLTVSVSPLLGWAPGVVASSVKFPATVYYNNAQINPTFSTANSGLDYGVVKTLAAQQTTAPYTVSYTINGVAQKPVTVPALPVVTPPKTVIGTFTCKVVEYSDMTFTTTNADCAVAK